MDRKKASDFDPGLLKLFDQYVHGLIDRRGFLEAAVRFAVGGVTAAMLLEALSPRFAEAEQVPKNDARLKTGTVEYDSPQGSGKVRGYLARPPPPRASYPRSWWCTKIAVSIRTSRTSRGASRSSTSWPSPPTR